MAVVVQRACRGSTDTKENQNQAFCFKMSHYIPTCKTYRNVPKGYLTPVYFLETLLDLWSTHAKHRAMFYLQTLNATPLTKKTSTRAWRQPLLYSYTKLYTYYNILLIYYIIYKVILYKIAAAPLSSSFTATPGGHTAYRVSISKYHIHIANGYQE